MKGESVDFSVRSYSHLTASCTRVHRDDLREKVGDDHVTVADC